MTDRSIVVSDLVKIYRGRDGDDVRALAGISFEVREGEVFGLLGPNGAGKTTALEILEGLRKPTSGDAEVVGISVRTRDRSQRATLRSSIGVQLQESDYFEELTLEETLRLLASYYPRSLDPETLLARVSLSEKARAKYGELSGGQARRFSIAAALVNDPQVLFLDEPTTGLDPQARRNLWELVGELKAESSRTIVLTTHYMEEAELLCDRVAIVDHGRVVALDSPRNLVASLGGDYAGSVVVSGIGAEVVERSVARSQKKKVVSQRAVEGTEDAGPAEPGGHAGERLAVELVSESPAGIFESVNRIVAAGGRIEDLSIRTASLEDVFLNLTGRALRD